MGNEINNCEYTNTHFIVSLFLFLQEFTRMKWGENENKEREKNFFITRCMIDAKKQ